jgi:Xaa-Pro aminopeptidase
MGLDVHDMEDLGQIYVGYDDEVRPSTQFGTAYLRFGRRLKEGFVLTVEPGIYFIPSLIDKWRADGMHKDFINYDKLDAFKGFGGIRIEDDVLVTADGYRLLGNAVPKTVADIEAIMQR